MPSSSSKVIESHVAAKTSSDAELAQVRKGVRLRRTILTFRSEWVSPRFASLRYDNSAPTHVLDSNLAATM